MGVTLYQGVPIMDALAYAGSLKIQEFLSNPEILVSNLVTQAQGNIVGQSPRGITVQIHYVSRNFVKADKYFRLGQVEAQTDPTVTLTGDAVKSPYRTIDRPVTIMLESESVDAQEIMLQLYLSEDQVESISRALATASTLQPGALTWNQRVGADSELGAQEILNAAIAHEFELKLVRRIIDAIVNATNDGRTTTINPAATDNKPSYIDFVLFNSTLLGETGRLFERTPLIGLFHPAVARWIYMVPEFKETGVTSDARNLVPQIYQSYDVPVVTINDYKGSGQNVDCYLNVVSLPRSTHYWVNMYDGPSFGNIGRRTYGGTILRSSIPVRLAGENLIEFIFRMQMAAIVPKTVRPTIAIYPVPVSAVAM